MIVWTRAGVEVVYGSGKLLAALVVGAEATGRLHLLLISMAAHLRLSLILLGQLAAFN